MSWMGISSKKNFLEDRKFIHTKDKFDPNASAYELFDQYCTWVKSEHNERTRETLLSLSLQVINRYFTIGLGKLSYMIPYQSNKESVDMLLKVINDENICYKLFDGDEFTKYCRC